jgi:hypothetical protein
MDEERFDVLYPQFADIEYKSAKYEEYDKLHSERYDSWMDWSEKHAVNPWGICEFHKKEENNETSHI